MKYWRTYVKRLVRQPAYRLVLHILNKYRLRLLFTFLLGSGVAFLEGSTYVLIYLALGVLSGTKIDMPFVGDRLLHWPKPQVVSLLIGAAILVQIFQSALKYTSALITAYLGNRINLYLKERIMHRIFGFSYACITRYRYGELLDYISTSGMTISILVQTWNRLILHSLMTIAYLAVLIWISPILLIATLIVSAGLLLIQRQVVPRIEKNSRKLANNTVLVDSFIVESIQGIRLIYSFNQQLQILKKLHHLQMDLLKLNDRQVRWSALPQPLSQALVTTILGIMLLFGLWILSQDRPLNLVLPALATFISAYNRFANQGQSVVNQLADLAQRFGAVARLNEFLTNEDKEFLRVEGKPFPGLRREIRFDRVT
ncbi:MAG: ABC transporter ATP-binding protein/permease, partial [Gloeomargarita sp. SKYB31]|nr:ABC transporter ATP-binding protein/permease [Gloeomargarita sp. SKYB31]